MPRDESPGAAADASGAMTKQEGPRPSPKLETRPLIGFKDGRSSNEVGRPPLQVRQSRFKSGSPNTRISGAECCANSTGPGSQTQDWPLSYDRKSQYSTSGPSLQLRDHAP